MRNEKGKWDGNSQFFSDDLRDGIVARGSDSAPSSSSSNPLSMPPGGNWIEHQVSKMDTLAGIAIKYGVEDDHEGVRTVDDDAFIDDSGVDPADRFGSDNEAGSTRDHPQVEEGQEDEEIKKLFKGGKKKKKNERTPAEIALYVEHQMAELEVTAEEDAELNRQSKPTINKLKKLPLLIEVLSNFLLI